MQPQVRFGRHRFDAHTGQLWAGEHEVRLTPKAAAVLAALVGCAGRPVTRDELFASVWSDAVVSDAALTACIRELRSALRDDPRRPRFIETRHRRGYRFVPSLSSAALPVGRAPSSSFLVGRARELGHLHAGLARAVAADRQIILVTGEPGIGKTALVETFLAEIDGAEGLRIAHGRCVEHYGAGEPYLPLLEAVTRLCRQPGGRRVLALLRRHAPSWLVQMPSLLSAADRRTLARQTSGATRARMLRELAEAVEILAAEAPLVLFLEDLHWSDASTVAWLTYMGRRPDPARLLIVGTCRPAETMDPRHPLPAVSAAARGHGRELTLPPLDQAGTLEYLARRFPGTTVLGDLAPTIHRRTGGHPLFVATVADDLVRRAVLVERNGRWEIPDRRVLAEIPIPEDVRRLVRYQLDRLRPDERRLLEAASAAGDEFPTAAVAAALALAVGEVEDRCAALARSDLFVVSRGVVVWPDGTVSGRYAFRHALYREVIDAQVPAGRAAELHRRLGARLTTAFGERSDEIAAELAMHFERGRDTARAIRALHRAGAMAAERNAAPEAVAHLARALDLLATLPDTLKRAREEVTLRIALGGPLMALEGRGAARVERTYTRAQELCRRVGDTPQLFPSLWGLFLFRRSRGEIAVAHELAERLLPLARRTGDTGLVLQAHHALWATRFARGELRAAREHCAKATALYDPDRHAPLAAVYGHHDAGVCGLAYGAWTLELLGESDQASDWIEKAIALARTLGHRFSEAHALLHASRLHHLRGDWRRSGECAETAAALAREGAFPQLLAWADVTRGWALTRTGDVQKGIAMMREGIATVEALGSRDLITYFVGTLAESLAGTGKIDEALGAVTRALAEVKAGGEAFYAAELHRLRGELLATTGDRTEAAACFRTALRIARRQQARTLLRRVLTSLEAAGLDPVGLE